MEPAVRWAGQGMHKGQLSEEMEAPGRGLTVGSRRNGRMAVGLRPLLQMGCCNAPTHRWGCPAGAGSPQTHRSTGGTPGGSAAWRRGGGCGMRAAAGGQTSRSRRQGRQAGRRCRRAQPTGTLTSADSGAQSMPPTLPPCFPHPHLHLGEVVVGPAGPAQQLCCVVVEVEAKVPQGARHRVAVHVGVLLPQVPPAPAVSGFVSGGVWCLRGLVSRG